MKNRAGKLMQQINTSKTMFITTLVDGQDAGHCTGVKERMDPLRTTVIK